MAVWVSVGEHWGTEDGAWVVENGGCGVDRKHTLEELAIEVKAALQQTETRLGKLESRERICRLLEAMERHHQLTYSTSIIHLAIAIASISSSSISAGFGQRP
jgi:hypothetical protein